MRKPITTDTSVNRENTNEESVLEEKSSKSFRRKSSVGGRMRKPVGASVSLSGGGEQEAAEPHRPVSRTRGRARVRGDEEKISSERIDTSEESTDVETEEKGDKGTSRGRVRAPPSLASVVRHR